MYYFNDITLTTNSNKAAEKALESLKSRLANGFNCDTDYTHTPSSMLMDGLYVDRNIITVPEDFYCCRPEDSEMVFVELLKSLSEDFSEEFVCEINCNAEYSDGIISAIYKDGVLKITDTYYPSGSCEFVCCDECGVDVKFDINDPNARAVCPECGEEIDLSDYLAVIAEYIF